MIIYNSSPDKMTDLENSTEVLSKVLSNSANLPIIPFLGPNFTFGQKYATYT